MSTSIQLPDLGLDVKYSRNVKKKEDKEESQVDICENEDTRHHSHIDLWFHGVRPATHNIRLAAKRSYCKHAANVGIVATFYLLILAGIYIRYILATMEYHNVVTERDQLNTSLNEAQTKNINLTKERNELQNSYDNLYKTYSFLLGIHEDFKQCILVYGPRPDCYHLLGLM